MGCCGRSALPARESVALAWTTVPGWALAPELEGETCPYVRGPGSPCPLRPELTHVQGPRARGEPYPVLPGAQAPHLTATPYSSHGPPPHPPEGLYPPALPSVQASLALPHPSWSAPRPLDLQLWLPWSLIGPWALMELSKGTGVTQSRSASPLTPWSWQNGGHGLAGSQPRPPPPGRLLAPHLSLLPCTVTGHTPNCPRFLPQALACLWPLCLPPWLTPRCIFLQAAGAFPRPPRSLLLASHPKGMAGLQVGCVTLTKPFPCLSGLWFSPLPNRAAQGASSVGSFYIVS